MLAFRCSVALADGARPRPGLLHRAAAGDARRSGLRGADAGLVFLDVHADGHVCADTMQMRPT